MQALVIFGHTRPGPRQYDFYFKHLQRDMEALNVPVLYIHGDALLDEPKLQLYEPYEDLGFEMKALEVQRGGIAQPMEVVISDEGFLVDRQALKNV